MQMQCVLLCPVVFFVPPAFLLFRRLRVLDVTESALKVLGHCSEPSALYQYAADLERTGRLEDLLSEESSEQLNQLMRMTRFIYAHV